MPSRRVPRSCSRRGAGSAAKASVGSRWRDRESVRTATACAFMIGIPSFACVGRRLGSGDGVCRDRFESLVEQCRGVEFLLGGFARHEIYGVLLERDDFVPVVADVVSPGVANNGFRVFDADALILDKIGRASCRERVCQYV